MISRDNALVSTIPPARLDVTVLLTTVFWHHNTHAVFYHCIIGGERRTFLRGKCQWLGLYCPETEYECQELHGKSIIQCLIATSNTAFDRGHAYVLTKNGELYSLGFADSRLGRSTKATVFGVVPIRETVSAIASGISHCLAMSGRSVFAFGHNSYGQCGVSNVGNRISAPTNIYTGTGGNAPVQVATGNIHSAILTRSGQVYTCGEGKHGQTGHGGNQNIFHPTLIRSLIHDKVEQIGCTGGANLTGGATFFLAKGKLYGCGYNIDSSLGLGHDVAVNIPTLIKTGSAVITSFRCSLTMVVAYTKLHDALVWGVCRGGMVIKVPQIAKLEFPRDVFFRGTYDDTGGAVYPASRGKVCELEDKLKQLCVEMESSKSRERTLKSDLDVCKQKLFELEKQYNQEKTSHAQMEQRLLAEMASHEETRIQLQNTCNAYEKTQQESEVNKEKLLKLEEQHRKMVETHGETEQHLLRETAEHEETRTQVRNACSAHERTQQELDDSRKREGNMTFATERLSGDLRKALEENNVLADKVEGYQEKIRNFERQENENKDRDVALLLKLNNFLEHESTRLGEQQATLQYAADIFSEGRYSRSPSEPI